MFYNQGTLDSDESTRLRKDVDNARYSNYMLGGFSSQSLGTPQDLHVLFATQQPGILYYGLNTGNGLDGSIVDFESQLTFKSVGINRPSPGDKTQLFQRPFVTVPYLGRGVGDPVIESQLLQGQQTYDTRSVSTAMEASTLKYLPPVNATMQGKVDNSSFVQEAALNGWTRGGSQTRKTVPANSSS